MIQILLKVYGLIKGSPKTKDYASTFLGVCVGFYAGTVYVENKSTLATLDQTLAFYEAIQATEDHYSSINDDQYEIANKLLKQQQAQTIRIIKANEKIKAISEDSECKHVSPAFIELYRELHRAPVTTETSKTKSNP